MERIPNNTDVNKLKSKHSTLLPPLPPFSSLLTLNTLGNPWLAAEIQPSSS